MAGVFLSYDRDDGAAAKVIATALEKAGHSVWWDLHVRGGAQFSKVIEEALKAADAVVVLWSAKAIESAWVRDEATAGRDTGRLIPAAIDGTDAPLGFRQFQTIDLTDWKRASRSRGYAALEHAVNELGGKPTAPAPAATPQTRIAPPNGFPTWAFALPLLGAIAGALYFFWPSTSSAIPAVSVVASEPLSKPLARDLLVKLGSLQAAKSGSMRLLGDDAGRGSKADLVFEVAGDPGSARPSANLLLMGGTDGSVLWSKAFEQETGTLADLKQQLAFTAARVLGCALDARNTGTQSLSSQTLKVYLNACAQLSEIGAVDASPVIPPLLQVTRDAPWFKGGWAKLLAAEAQSADPLGRDEEARKLLRQHIESARRLDPAMPQIALAEVSELSPGSYARAAYFLDRAKEAHPDDVDVLVYRSAFLMDVGRLREAIQDAGRAAELDPLSPLVRNEYISTLAYGGRIDTAREELKAAERLWPGTISVQDIQFRFNLRYGDPKEAQGLSGRNSGPALDLFLKARMQPTAENIRQVTSYLPGNRIHDPQALANLAQAMAEFHQENELFALLLQPTHRTDLANIIVVLFRPGLRKFRQDRRFLQLMNAAGVLDYWRESGHWPDFCFEPDLPYDCKKVAAAITA